MPGAENKKKPLILSGHLEYVRSATFSSDAVVILSPRREKTPGYGTPKAGQAVRTLAGHLSRVWSARSSPRRTPVVTASFDNTARVWDRNTGAVLRSLVGHKHLVAQCGVQPGRQAYRHNVRCMKTVWLWEVKKGPATRVGTAGPECGVQPGWASRRRCVRWEKTARLAGCRERADQIAVLRGHADRVTSAAFDLTGTEYLPAHGIKQRGLGR